MINPGNLAPSSILTLLHDQKQGYNSLSTEEVNELEAQLICLVGNRAEDYKKSFIPSTFERYVT